MKETYKKTQRAYEEIFSVIEKHKELINFDVQELVAKSKNHLFGIELKEKYGLDIEPRNVSSLDWLMYGDYRSIGRWGKKYRRTISWLDDGRQPEDEVLLQISFSTGAYIFGEDYPVELFKKFFQELKSYNPDYLDTTNRSLYWKMDNASKVFNEFPNILKRYYEMNKEDAKQRKIKKIQEELKKLTNNE